MEISSNILNSIILTYETKITQSLTKFGFEFEAIEFDYEDSESAFSLYLKNMDESENSEDIVENLAIKLNQENIMVGDYSFNHAGRSNFIRVDINSSPVETDDRKFNRIVDAFMEKIGVWAAWEYTSNGFRDDLQLKMGEYSILFNFFDKVCINYNIDQKTYLLDDLSHDLHKFESCILNPLQIKLIITFFYRFSFRMTINFKIPTSIEPRFNDLALNEIEANFKTIMIQHDSLLLIARNIQVDIPYDCLNALGIVGKMNFNRWFGANRVESWRSSLRKEFILHRK